MELTQLRYFAEAARLQHITRAAEQLHIAQPALTQALHRLEAELEVPLFVQRGRGVVTGSCLRRERRRYYGRRMRLKGRCSKWPRLKAARCI